MSSLDREILGCIRKIRMRIHRNIVIDYIVWGIIIALFCGSIISIASLLIPLYKTYIIVVRFVAIGAVFSLIIGLIRIPRTFRTARIIDSLGLSERTVTAIELVGREDGFAVLQKKDTLEKLKNLDYKSELPLFIAKKQVLLLCIFTFIIVGSIFIPSPAKSRAEEKYKFNIMQEEKIERIEKTEKDIKNSISLREEDRKSLLNDLSSLKQEIKDAKNTDELNNALTKFQVKTNNMKDEYKENDLNNIVSGLSQNGSTENLAQAIESGNKEEVNRAVEALPEALKNASAEEQKKTAEDFLKMANNTENSELKKSLNEIAQKLASDNPEKFKDLSSSLSEFNNSLSKSIENREAKNELKYIQSDLLPEKSNEVNSNSNSQDQASSNQNTSGNSGEGSNTSGQSSTPGQSDAPEQSNTPGQDNTNKSNGTTSNQNGENKENNSSGFNKQGGNSSSQGESVYVPQQQGSENSEESTEIVSEGTAGLENGKAQSLEKVIGKYKEKAFDNMNSYVIPEAMKDIIKSYFTSLEE